MFQKFKGWFVGLFAVGTAAVATSANAAVDAAVSTALTSIQTDAVALAGIVTPIVVAILALGISIKLIKRFASKV